VCVWVEVEGTLVAVLVALARRAGPRRRVLEARRALSDTNVYAPSTPNPQPRLESNKEEERVYLEARRARAVGEGGCPGGRA